MRFPVAEALAVGFCFGPSHHPLSGQGPVPAMPTPSAGHAGPVSDAASGAASGAGGTDGLGPGDKAAMLRAKAEGLKGEVERWQAARSSQSPETG